MSKAQTLEDVGKEIARLVGVPILGLPQPDHYAWWHPEKNNGEGQPRGGYVVFKRGEPFPWFDKLTVTAMFRDAEELRVYTLPRQPMGENEYGVRCYHLSKKDSGSYEVENLPVELFPQLIADEWRLVAELASSAEDERNRIVAYLESLEPAISANDAAEDIAEREHWQEPPEPEPAPQPVQAPNGAGESPSPGEPLPG